MPRKSGRIFQAKTTFYIAAGIVDKSEHAVRKGQTVREGHKLLKVCPEHFQPLIVDYELEEV